MKNPIWKILVITANEDDFLLVKEMLARLGDRQISVDWLPPNAADGDSVRERHYDAVLLDADLRQMSGIRLVKAITADKYSPPVILYTEQDAYELKQAARQAGAADFIIKSEVSQRLLERLIGYAIERKQTENALREALTEAAEGRRLLEALLEHVPEGISITGGPPDFRITHVSKWASTASGRAREELLNHPAGQHQEAWGLRLPDGDTLPTAEQTPLYQASHFGQELNNMEMVIETKYGRKMPILLNAAPVRDSQGNIIGAINCWMDITKRKQAEALAAMKVVEAEEFAREADLRRAELDAIIEQMDEAVILYGLDGIAKRANRSAISAFGFDPSGMLPEEVSSKVQFADAEGSLLVPEQFLSARALKGEIIHGETIGITGMGGKRMIASASARPFFDAAGGFIGVVLTWHDITEREERTQELRESEERFRLARQAVDGVVYDWDPIHQTVRQMDGAYDVLGYPADDGFPTDPYWWQSHIHPDDVESARQNLQDALAGATEGIDCEYRFQHQEGHWVHLWDRAYILRNAEGQPARVVGIAVDVTERKAAQARAAFLQQLGRDLNAAQSPNEVGAMVVERLGEFLQVDRCFIAESDLAARTNQIRYDYQRPGYEFKDLQLLSWRPTGISHYLQADKEIVVEDAAHDLLTEGFYEAVLAEVGARAFVLVPLESEEDQLSLLAVLYCKPHRWNNQDVQLMQQAARLAWLAIERARVSERLRQSDERFRIALDQAPISVFTQDRDLRFTWVYNPLGGYAANALIGRLEQELLPQDQIAEMLALKRDVIELGVPRQKEFHIRMGNDWMDMILNARPVFNAEGQVSGLIGAVMDVSDLRRLQAQQAENEAKVQAQRWLMEHREKERMQLARILHDQPLQDLLAVHLYLENAVDTLDTRCRENLRQARQMLEQAINELRSLALELRPPMLMHMGLEKAMRAYANNFSQRNPRLAVQLALEQDQPALSEELRLALYRIYQELLQNVSEHAGASQVWVTLQFSSGELVLVVKDDGCGFEPPEQWVDLAQSGRFGLVGIRERLEFFKGSLQLDTQPGGGTRVEVRVPFAQLE